MTPAVGHVKSSQHIAVLALLKSMSLVGTSLTSNCSQITIYFY